VDKLYLVTARTSSNRISKNVIKSYNFTKVSTQILQDNCRCTINAIKSDRDIVNFVFLFNNIILKMLRNEAYHFLIARNIIINNNIA